MVQPFLIQTSLRKYKAKEEEDNKMYCQKCGAELRQDAAFCEACGEKVEKQIPKETKKGAKGNKLVLLLAVVAIGVLAALLLGKGIGKKSINMNDYLNISFSGYDTVGSAYFTFDYYGFLEDYGEKIKYKSSKVREEIGLNPCKLIEQHAWGELDKSTMLTNGEDIHFYWDDAEYVELPEFNYNLNFDIYTIKVEGLSELREVELFENVDVTFTNYAPYANAKIVNNSTDKDISKLSYKLSKNSNIDNGDVLTLSLNYSDDYSDEKIAIDLAKAYGIKAKELNKEIVVEGCSQYARTLEDVPEALMEQIKADSEKVIYNLASKWRKEITIEDVTYLGSYFFWMGDYPENEIDLIYKITVREYFPDSGIDNHVDIYYRSSFSRIAVLVDGTFSSSDGNFYTYDYFDREMNDKFLGRYHHMFETYQDLYNKELASDVAKYTYYTDVNIQE